MMVRDSPDAQSSTVACLSRNDYEWIIAPEADDLRIAGLMRRLHGASARRHTRAGTPFFTGHRKPTGELAATLS
ncbi:MAG: chlorite dismutase family protein [Streptosporangiaceae bacterium]